MYACLMSVHVSLSVCLSVCPSVSTGASLFLNWFPSAGGFVCLSVILFCLPVALLLLSTLKSLILSPSLSLSVSLCFVVSACVSVSVCLSHVTFSPLVLGPSNIYLTDNRSPN